MPLVSLRGWPNSEGVPTFDFVFPNIYEGRRVDRRGFEVVDHVARKLRLLEATGYHEAALPEKRLVLSVAVDAHVGKILSIDVHKATRRRQR